MNADTPDVEAERCEVEGCSVWAWGAGSLAPDERRPCAYHLGHQEGVAAERERAEVAEASLIAAWRIYHEAIVTGRTVSPTTLRRALPQSLNPRTAALGDTPREAGS